MNLDILCSGSLTLDRFIDPDELDIRTIDGTDTICIPVGAKISVGKSYTFVGGGAANSAIGFAKMGLRSGVMGVVGDDDRARFIRHQLHRYDINDHCMHTVSGGHSSASTILMTPGGRRTVFCHKLEDKALCQTLCAASPPTRAMYLSHIPRAHEGCLEGIIAWHERTGGRLFWNPGKTQFAQGLDRYKDLLPRIEILILNVEEAEMFTGQTATRGAVPVSLFAGDETKTVADAHALAQPFLDAGVQAVVITDGRHGAQYVTATEHLYAPALGGKPVSTLGAGDAFSVGVVSAALHEKDPATQMHWGALNSASTIRHFGAQVGQMTLGELTHRRP